MANREIADGKWKKIKLWKKERQKCSKVILQYLSFHQSLDSRYNACMTYNILMKINPFKLEIPEIAKPKEIREDIIRYVYTKSACSERKRSHFDSVDWATK